jgi:transcriptional regulator with XRE-family HTH domain
LEECLKYKASRLISVKCLIFEATMPDLIELGALIKEARRQRGLTQTELAKRSGVSRARLEALENARITGIGFKQLLRIINSLGLDLRITELNKGRPTLEDLLEEKKANHAARLDR